MQKEQLGDPIFVKSSIESYLSRGFLWFKKGNKLLQSKEQFVGVENASKLSAGLNNITYSLDVKYKYRKEQLYTREYILRFVDKRNPHKVQNEVKRMIQASKLNIPMPIVLLFEKNPAKLGYPFFIMEKIKGEPLMNVVERLTPMQVKIFLSELAHSLGVLHSQRSDKWDSYYLSPKKLREIFGRKYTYADYIMHEVKNILNYFNKLNLSKKHDIDIQYLYKWFKGHIPLLNIDAYSLIHGDVRPSNIIVNTEILNENQSFDSNGGAGAISDGEMELAEKILPYSNSGWRMIGGIIDWEMSCYSDPAQDLGWTLFFFKLYEKLRKERGFFFKEYWKYCKNYDFEARVDFYESFASIKLYTYAVSLQKSNPNKFERNKEFFSKVIKETPKYLDRISHRD